MQTQLGYDPKAIRALFDEMASTYAIVNFIASFGFAARWRHQLVQGLPLANASHVVDLMSGMNELCRSVAPHAAPTLRLTAIDISPEMIDRARKNWPFPVEIHLRDVLAWDSEPACADAVISSFGLKTFDRTQQQQLSERVLVLVRHTPAAQPPRVRHFCRVLGGKSGDFDVSPDVTTRWRRNVG